MKTIITIGITAIFIYIGELFFPWWISMTIAFIMGYLIPNNAFRAFITGFLSVFLLWLVFALLINMQNGSLIAERIGALFGLPNALLIALLSAAIGGLAAGIAALSGYHFKQLFVKTSPLKTRYKI